MGEGRVPGQRIGCRLRLVEVGKVGGTRGGATGSIDQQACVLSERLTQRHAQLLGARQPQITDGRTRRDQGETPESLCQDLVAEDASTSAGERALTRFLLGLKRPLAG